MDFLLAAVDPAADQAPGFLTFVTTHWRFCLLHFLEFAIWGAWFVVLGNMLSARGFSGKEIGRAYATIPIGNMVTPLFVGALADKYINTEVLIGAAHLIGAVLLFAMAKAKKPATFYVCALLYAFSFAPTLGLVNSIVFAHNDDIFGGAAQAGFPWIRVFGTIGWIVAGLSHALILKKDKPVNENPLLLACGLSIVLGLFAFTLPETKPAAVVKAEQRAAVVAAAKEAGKPVPPEEEGSSVGVFEGSIEMLKAHPVFFGVTFVSAMAMGLYFAFAALFLEKTGVAANTIGPVMTIGQWIEIFFMLTLPWFLGGKSSPNMNWVLLVGVCAWALRFGLFAVGKPLALVLFGIAIHGICFDFFFAAGFINMDIIAPKELTATAQTLYGFLVYGLGMFVGSEVSGWLNERFTNKAEDGTETTDWKKFWMIPCVVVTIGAVLFGLTVATQEAPPADEKAEVSVPADDDSSLGEADDDNAKADKKNADEPVPAGA